MFPLYHESVDGCPFLLCNILVNLQGQQPPRIVRPAEELPMKLGMSLTRRLFITLSSARSVSFEYTGYPTFLSLHRFHVKKRL